MRLSNLIFVLVFLFPLPIVSSFGQATEGDQPTQSTPQAADNPEPATKPNPPVGNAKDNTSDKVTADQIAIPRKKESSAVAPSPFMQGFNWFAITALIVTVITQVILYVERQSARQRELTLSLYRQWSSEHYQAIRYRVWEYLTTYESKFEEARKHDIDFAKVPISKIKNEKGEVGRDVSAIDHFIADLHVLFAANLIDEELSRELFGYTILGYLGRFETLIEYDLPVEREWFYDKMLPLRQYLEGTR